MVINRMKEQKKQQNKGFTLIEVLVAMLILAIIVAPLLHAFVTASITNAKAKQLLRATTLAQNVMEEMKAYSLEDIARQFNGYAVDTGIAGLGNGAYEAVLDGTDYVPAKTAADVEVEGGTVTASVGDEGVFLGQEDEAYHFILNEVAMQNAMYDVAIHVTENQYNGTYKIADITSMNRSDCAYYAQESDLDALVAKEFETRNINYGDNATAQLSATEFQALMSRKITIDVEAENNGNESVKVTYLYSIPSGYAADTELQYSEYRTVFDNYASGETLKAVYLYYYPLYGTGRTDTIEIENNANCDIDVYLIKMKDANYNAFNDLDYRPIITLKETEGTDEGSHTNICTNIANANYNYTVVGGTIRKTDLGNESEVTSYFDVKVEVYKHASGALTEDNLITSFTGSLLDNSVRQ